MHQLCGVLDRMQNPYSQTQKECKSKRYQRVFPDNTFIIDLCRASVR